MWFIAAYDRGSKKSDTNGEDYFKCRGCYFQLHASLDQSGVRYKSWKRAMRDPFLLLIIFSSLLFILWAATGVMGLIANNSGTSKIVFFSSILVYCS